MINKMKQYDWKKYNYALLIVVILLCMLSALTVKLAGGEKMGNSYMKSQLIGMVLGLIIVAGLSLLDYHFICRFSVICYLGGVLLTAATHTALGTDNDTDATRWISLGGITFQPTELMKIILILTLAALFVKLRNRLDRVSTLLLVAAVTAVPVLLILTQPDLSSSLVAVFIMIVMIVVSGLSYKILTPLIGLGIPLSLLLFWYVQQPYNLILQNYQYERIMAWLHPDNDPKDLNYQQNHSIRAIASGGLTGKFIQDGGAESGKSRLYSSVSVKESDFIWSVIGEEFGFLGCCVILGLMGFVVFRCFIVAKKAQDYLGKMIATGVAAMYMFQIFANICVATRIFPNTGLPLPFLSNGLSSMISSMIGIGLIMNIGIQPAKSSKGGFSMRNLHGNSPDTGIDFDLEL